MFNDAQLDLLARLYARILSWPEPQDENHKEEDPDPPVISEEQPEKPEKENNPPKPRSAEDVLQELGY